MKRLVILSACLAISLAGWAQGNRNDSLRMDSIITIAIFFFIIVYCFFFIIFA